MHTYQKKRTRWPPPENWTLSFVDGHADDALSQFRYMIKIHIPAESESILCAILHDR